MEVAQPGESGSQRDIKWAEVWSFQLPHLQAHILTRSTGPPRSSIHLGGYKPPRPGALALAIIPRPGRQPSNTVATSVSPSALSRTAMGGAILPPHRLRQRHAAHQTSTSRRRSRRTRQHIEQCAAQNESTRAANHGGHHRQRDNLLFGRLSSGQVVRQRLDSGLVSGPRSECS